MTLSKSGRFRAEASFQQLPPSSISVHQPQLLLPVGRVIHRREAHCARPRTPSPSAQNQSHGQIVHEPMLFAECDCRVSLACNNGSLTAKLMHPEAYRSCHCLAKRMLRCICITAGLSANPQRLIGIAEKPECHAVV